MKRLHFLLILIAFAGCKRENAEQPLIQFSVPVEFRFSGEEVVPDTLRYTTPSGYLISVSRLEFYLSNPSTTIAEGSIVTDKTTYINLKAPSTHKVFFSLPDGKFGSEAHIVFGVAKSRNKADGLENTSTNINMAWPIPMGSGYHHIKYEGHFVENGQTLGFALHTGMPTEALEVSLGKPMGTNPTLVFDLAAMLENWDWENQPTQSMGKEALMNQLQQNAKIALKWK